MIDERDRLRDALALVDEQHTILWVKLERLRDAVASRETDRVQGALKALAAYLRIHFEAEQEVMQSLAYPRWEEHVAKHRIFEDEIATLGERLEAEVTSAAPFEEWLSTHERTDDQALIEFVKLRLRQDG